MDSLGWEVGAVERAWESAYYMPAGARGEGGAALSTGRSDTRAVEWGHWLFYSCDAGTGHVRLSHSRPFCVMQRKSGEGVISPRQGGSYQSRPAVESD